MRADSDDSRPSRAPLSNNRLVRLALTLTASIQLVTFFLSKSPPFGGWQPWSVLLVAGIPLRIAGDPRDIAAAVLFLASDDAAHITGAVLDVDGGSGAGRFWLASHIQEHADVQG